jgi:hypothetical protein
MPYEVTLTKAVAKRLKRIRYPQIERAVERAFDQLKANPFVPRPDKERNWKDAFPGIANHRHVDLPHGWRMGYTVDSRRDLPDRVIVVFLGTHREYDHKYGFRPSG